MKKLSIAALLIITLSTGAVAHEGAIGLYTDLTATDCDLTLVPFLSYDISILYDKSNAGPNGILSAQFKIELLRDTLIIQDFIKSPVASIELGEISTGIIIGFPNCTGIGQDYLLIGTVVVVAFTDEVHMLRPAVADDIDPDDLPVAVRVELCDEEKSKHAVLGGYFTSPNGTCYHIQWPSGTESTSWGAIKGLYR